MVYSRSTYYNLISIQYYFVKHFRKYTNSFFIVHEKYTFGKTMREILSLNKMYMIYWHSTYDIGVV